MYGARPLRSTRRLNNLVGVLPRWWKIENKATIDGPTMVSIYDEIGLYGVSAQDFLADMRNINGDIEMHINSPGGDVFDGIAIYNQLKQHQNKGTVHIVVDGLAASAASFIAQAASPGHLEMAPHSQMMIHDGFAMGIGNAADMKELANQLDRASDNIAAIYASRTGKPADYWRDLMRNETWLSDTEAVKIGLADKVQGTGTDASDSWDLSVFDKFTAGAIRNASDGKKAAKAAKKAAKAAGQPYDPDHDGDDDSTAEGDTDHDYVNPDGSKVKPKKTKAAADTAITNAAVDNSPWDAAKAWHNGAVSDNPEAFYRGICAGIKNGDPETQAGWALPYKYTPDSPPNAAGVRNALARLSQTQGLTNKTAAKETLESAMEKINPDYDPGNLDYSLLSAVLLSGLGGGLA